MPRAKGTRSDASSCAIDLPCTGRVRWLSAGTDPWPGKCLMTGRTPAELKPVAAATTCSATTPGRDEADRDPIVGSPGPDVTSASGAKSTVKPSPRSSAAPAAYASCVSARVTSGAGAHEGREPGRRAAQPLDDATLLVDAEEERPRAGDLAGQRPVDGPDLLGRGHVGTEGDHASEVQVADHPHRGVGPLPVGDDDLTGEVGQLHPADDPRRPVQLGPRWDPTPPPARAPPTASAGRSACSWRPCSLRSAPRPRPGPARRTRPATRRARGRLRGPPGARRGGSASRHGGTAPRTAHRPRRSGRSQGQSLSSQAATAAASGWSSPARSARTHDCTLTSCWSDLLG